MEIMRLERDEEQIESLETDLLAFAKLVEQSEATLRKALAKNNQLAALAA